MGRILKDGAKPVFKFVAITQDKSWYILNLCYSKCGLWISSISTT